MSLKYNPAQFNINSSGNLDIISGTSAYNKTMTVSQALEAHSSLIVHQAYLGNQLQELFRNQLVNSPNNTNMDLASPIVETAIYKDMLHMLNDTLYSTYSEDIMNALEEEKEPEVKYYTIIISIILYYFI